MLAVENPEDLAPGANPRTAITVSDLTGALREIVEGAFLPLWIRGEVTGFKSHRNGHWYFCLRDKAAQLNCVVWASDQRGMPSPPDDGMQVVALGRVTVYTGRGELQCSIKAIQADGDGLWEKAMRKTVDRLRADGLLAPERKRPLPRCPERVAVVTSPDGAALRDIIAVAHRRAPWVEIVVVPAKVQGDDAVDEICRALDRVSRWGRADTVIVGRGGGGREALWTFNDERLARAVAACSAPTISAVGHEVDMTVCDLVADYRAATPSAAAEAAVPVAADLGRWLDGQRRGLTRGAQRRVDEGRASLLRTGRAMARGARGLVETRRHAVRASAERLNGLSPLATLARGYAVAQDTDGRVLTSVESFSQGSRFDVQLRDGRVRAQTTDVRPGATPVVSPDGAP